MTYFNHFRKNGSFIDLAIIWITLDGTPVVYTLLCETNIANQLFDFWSWFLDFKMLRMFSKRFTRGCIYPQVTSWGYLYWPVKEGRWEVPQLQIVLLFLLKHFSATSLCYERTIRLVNAPFTEICWFPKCVTKEQVGVVCGDWLQVSLRGTVPIISPLGSICF